MSHSYYKEITENIEVAVEPEYLDSQLSSSGDSFFWAYHVRIKNKGVYPVQLVNRYWKIIDEKGTEQEIEGEGVVGEKPIIEPDSFFQYTSGAHLSNPSGIMTGYYGMKKINGEIFNVKIPAFSLDVPNLKRTTN